MSPLDFYLVAALASLWFAGKAGAWENYFFEALVALSCVAGWGWRGSHAMESGCTGCGALAGAGPGRADVAHPQRGERYLALSRQSNEAIAPILADTPIRSSRRIWACW